MFLHDYYNIDPFEIQIILVCNMFMLEILYSVLVL